MVLSCIPFLRERVGSFQASELLPDHGAVEQQRGSASPHRLGAGIGVAVVGALLATIWADVPDVRVDVQRRGVSFSHGLSF